MNSNSVLQGVLKYFSYHLHVFYLLSLVFIYNNTLHAQWVKPNGLYGGSIQCFTTSGANIFVGTSGGGVFYSSDSGSNWAQVNNGLIYNNVNVLAVNGENVYAGTSAGLSISTNNGSEWLSPNNSLLSEVTSIAFSGTDIFVVSRVICAGYYLNHSTDNGNTWTQLNPGLPANTSLFSLFVVDGNIFMSTSIGLYCSTDNGGTWTNINREIFNTFTFNGSYLFADTFYGAIYKSLNGIEWTQVYGGLSGSLINSLTSYGNNIYAGTNFGVLISTNNGSNWTMLNNGLPDYYVDAVTVLGSKIFVGLTSKGVFSSTDNGINWFESNNGINNLLINTFAVNGNNIFAGSYDGCVFRSTDNGLNWKRQLNLNDTTIEVISVSGNNIYAGNYDEGIFYSTDNGNVWTLLNMDGLKFSVKSLAVSGANLFAGTDSGIYLSTNNGINWTTTKGILPYAVYHLAINGNVIYAGTLSNGNFLSTINGNTWLPINSDVNVGTFAFGSSNIFACGNGVYTSTDRGLTWTLLYDNYPFSAPYLAASGTNIIIGQDNFGAYLSKDNGVKWFPALPSYTDKYIKSLAFCGDNVFLGTNRLGVWMCPVSELSGVPKETNNLPHEFSISQNFPNPFNPNTTIRYSLPKAGNVKLTVYDAIGCKVATIVNEYKPAGNYSVQFNGSKLASGIYFYRLESGNFSAAKKLILIK